MKRKLLCGLLVFALLVIAGSIGAIAWLLGTTDGARWAIGELPSHTSFTIKADRITGRLWDDLSLEGVSVRWPEGSALAAGMHLKWRPWSLLFSRVSVRELSIQDLRVRDNRPEEKTPPDFSWPQIKGLPLRFSGTFKIFRINGLAYQRLEENPVRLGELSALVQWHRGILSLREIRAALPSGNVEGSLSAGFVRPSVNADILFSLAQPLAGMKKISLEAKMQHKKAEAVMAGELHLTGSDDKAKRADLKTRIEIEQHFLKFTDFRVSRITPSGEVTGSGKVEFPEGGPRVHLNGKLAQIDLSPFLRRKTAISGEFAFEGGMEQYQGSFDLTNRAKGLMAFHASGVIRGDRNGLELTSLDGSWLEGSLRGEAGLRWGKIVTIDASLEARGLDPSVISKDWTGAVNADLRASAVLPEDRPVSLEFTARLLDSRLRGQALTGEISAGLQGKDLRIDRLSLHGKGFDIAAHGRLAERIFFNAEVGDLSGLVPGAKGEANAKGWLKLKDNTYGGDVSGRARNISHGDLKAGSVRFALHAGEGEGGPLKLKASASGLSVNQIEVASADISVSGTMDHHTLRMALSSKKATLKAEFGGGYRHGEWQGRVVALSEKDPSGTLNLMAPAELSISPEKVFLSSLRLAGTSSEQLEMGGELSFHPLQGVSRAEWRNVGLGRANPWLGGVQLSGTSSGAFRSTWIKGSIPHISGHITASGTVSVDDRKIALETLSAQLESDERKLRASVDLRFAGGGEIKGQFISNVQAGKLLPEEGEIDADLHDMALSFFRPWFPQQVDFHGMLSGSLKGKLLSGGRFDVAGSADISRGVISRHGEKGEISASVRTAQIRFTWRETLLSGKVSLAFEKYGRADGTFALPLPAHLPLKMDKNGSIKASIGGRFQEKGLLTALMPGLVQETHGEVEYSLNLKGAMENPDMQGSMKLSDAGAYLPTGGIRIKDVIVTARIERDRVIIDSFSASSGQGKIEGTAEIKLRGWMPEQYKGSLRGKDFQVIYLPELRVQASPDLTFEGTKKKLSVRGEIKIPDMLVRESGTKAPVQPSKDVVVVERRKPPERKIPIALDIKIKVSLGEDVLVKAEGLDAKLGGSVQFDIKGLNNITGEGAIHIVRGKFSAYGVNLDIERGRVLFSGQQVNRPNLDVFAVRKVGDIKAGVIVRGTLERPVVTLYSDPHMADTDILAYVVLGHPLGASAEQANLVAEAAGFLLSASDAVVFQSQLKKRLGIDTLDIESAPTTTSTKIGPEAPGPSAGGGVERSLVTVGKYLTPELYVSYGRSLIGEANLFRLRYSFSRHWELQTESGTESGADIFYKIDFK